MAFKKTKNSKLRNKKMLKIDQFRTKGRSRLRRKIKFK